MTNELAVDRAQAVLSAAVAACEVEGLSVATYLLYDAVTAVQKLLRPFVAVEEDTED